MFQTYIFDLYGTLVDIRTNEANPYLWKKVALYMTLQGVPYEASELKKAFRRIIQAERLANQQSYSSLGLTVPLEEIEVDFSRVIASLYHEKGIPYQEAATPCHEKGIPNIDALTIAHWATLFRTLSLKHLALYPETLSLLHTLKERKKKVYLLSNAQRLFTEPEMRSLGIYDLFDDILYSSDLGFTKPSPLFFQALLKKHSVDPSAAIMIGNDDQADNWGAHNSGLSSLYIQTEISPKLKSPLPNTCTQIATLNDVLSI